jgi:hypothetical protein
LEYESFSSITQRNLILDLDSANTNSYPGTGSVWTDVKGGNTFDLINNPTYTPLGFVFNGLDHRASENPINFQIDYTNKYTIIFVFKVTTGTPLIPILGCFKTAVAGNNPITIGLGYTGSFQGVVMGMGNVGSMQNMRTSTQITKDVFHFGLIEFTGGVTTDMSNYNIEIDGVVQVISSGGQLSAGSNTTTIGNLSGSTNSIVPFKGAIARSLVYNDNLTAIEKEHDYNLLNATYNFGT